MSQSGRYKRTNNQKVTKRDIGPYEAVVVNHLDTRYMGGLEVELIKYSGSGGTPEKGGELVQVRYLSPFYGITPAAGLTPNDGYQNTQKSYGMWAVPPDIGTRVLVIFAEGNLNLGYWIGCIPDDYMNFMVPDGKASTEQTTALTPDNIKGAKLPVGEYNKAFEDGAAIDPTLFKKPYNKDFTEVLETQGLLFDEIRGTTTTSARREIPSMVFGLSTPGPQDKRDGSPKVTIGPADDKVNVPYNRLGGSSFVMDDGDPSFIRKTHPEEGPPIYVNKMASEMGGKQTIPQNELLRFRTRTGHQIVMHNSEDLIYIGNARGTTWIEMTSDGKIDIHANDSVSIMTDNDLNITAERDINMEAGRNINMKATARYSKGAEQDAKGLESGRVQIEAQHNHNLLVGNDSKITVAGTMHTGVAENHFISTGKYLHINSGQDNRLTAGAYTHISSGKEHRETATYIHVNGPAAAQADQADTVEPLETVQLPYVFPGSLNPVAYDSILTRAPQHEPWPHHENLDPQSFKKTETDREAPGGLSTAERVLTPDSFYKNKGGRVASAFVAGSGGSISSGSQSTGGGTGTGQGTPPVDNYSSSFKYSDELGALSSKYESRGNPTAIGFDKTGGWSYGTYQLATRVGAFKGFMRYLKAKHTDVYELLQTAGGSSSAGSGTDTFKETWQLAMSEADKAETQHSYAVIQYFVPAADKVSKSTGIDVRIKSKTLQDVLWSTAIQHGAGGCNKIFKRAIKSTGNSAPTDEALIVAVYNERAKDNGMAYFPSSNANVRASCVKRFNNEKLDALKHLELEIKQASIPDETNEAGKVTLPVGPQ
tara:strand:- start:43876 stop:46344 length:2469 start_codon:yes stop_codon:yes gene_type:complete